MICKAWLGIAGLLLAVSAAVAADPEQAASEAELKAVVTASFEACREGKWDAYAKLIDPRDLADFKMKLRPVLQAAPMNPTAPGNGLLDLFDGGKDLKTIAGWQPQEFFARFMRGTTANTPIGMNYSGLKYKIIGIVNESADQAHAVVRVEKTMMTLKITRMEVVSLRRIAAADWRITMPEELRGLAQTLSATMFGPAVHTESVEGVALPEKP
ncbi:hypothetical protein [Anatilimnocola floriformis]|uniref:hypothetical protein n=1 Tax=Anatilimnocola floriformis TaxID=2948575 RepID=UPI0020C2C6BA|nr:hypothetical protein [Anatilimnocola floriformis]